MPVYVDDMRAPFGRLILCHMIADTHEELISMAQTIGVNIKWIQHANTPDEHFDIALSKRVLAVKAGAIEISWRECGAMIKRRQVEGVLGEPRFAETWLREWWRANRNKV